MTITTHARAGSLLVLLLLTMIGCAAPLQNGGVDVRPGAEARLETMCRLGVSGSKNLCVAPAEEE